METFSEPRPFVESRSYSRDRRRALASFDPGSLDPPIAELMVELNTLPCSFTLQSCYGHFISAPDQSTHSLERVPHQDCGSVRYRIAYVAICLENSPAGRTCHDELLQMAAADPDYVQFGSADWFWKHHPNSYALQVEPVRFRRMDQVVLDHAEALRVQHQRDLFFENLATLLRRLLQDPGGR